ncbi:hypothetical protein C8R46DRAFT_1234694 [Mycena filopes]|nr:hypothetical protein C8R46DRAFT_1234694 [Mycena filopes]
MPQYPSNARAAVFLHDPDNDIWIPPPSTGTKRLRGISSPAASSGWRVLAHARAPAFLDDVDVSTPPRRCPPRRADSASHISRRRAAVCGLHPPALLLRLALDDDNGVYTPLLPSVLRTEEPSTMSGQAYDLRRRVPLPDAASPYRGKVAAPRLFSSPSRSFRARPPCVALALSPRLVQPRPPDSSDRAVVSPRPRPRLLYAEPRRTPTTFILAVEQYMYVHLRFFVSQAAPPFSTPSTRTPSSRPLVVGRRRDIVGSVLRNTTTALIRVFLDVHTTTAQASHLS